MPSEAGCRAVSPLSLFPALGVPTDPFSSVISSRRLSRKCFSFRLFPRILFDIKSWLSHLHYCPPCHREGDSAHHTQGAITHFNTSMLRSESEGSSASLTTELLSLYFSAAPLELFVCLCLCVLRSEFSSVVEIFPTGL